MFYRYWSTRLYWISFLFNLVFVLKIRQIFQLVTFLIQSCIYIATILKHFISKPKGDARVYMYLILRSLDWFQQVVSIFFLCYLTHDKNREFRWYVSNLLDFIFNFSFNSEYKHIQYKQTSSLTLYSIYTNTSIAYS